MKKLGQNMLTIPDSQTDHSQEAPLRHSDGVDATADTLSVAPIDVNTLQDAQKQDDARERNFASQPDASVKGHSLTPPRTSRKRKAVMDSTVPRSHLPQPPNQQSESLDFLEGDANQVVSSESWRSRPGLKRPPEQKTRKTKRREQPLGDTSSNDSRFRRPKSHRKAVDPDLRNKDPLDPTAMTLKDLCGLDGGGRVSSRHVEFQGAHAEAKRSERERRARVALIREAKDKRDEDIDDPHAPLVKSPPHLTRDIGEQTLESMEADVADPSQSGSGFDYRESLGTKHYTVAVRMDASGQVVVDEDTLMVDRAADPEIMREEDTMTHVVETDISRFVNSASFSRKVKGSRWSQEETALFYEALRQFNTDFTMISLLMPGRSARECRNKFNAEDKRNKLKIDWALTNSIPIDVNTLARMTGKCFDDPFPSAPLPSTAQPEGIDASLEQHPPTTELVAPALDLQKAEIAGPSRSFQPEPSSAEIDDSSAEVIGSIDDLEHHHLFDLI